MAPTVLRLEQALRQGLIGEVMEINTVGKMGSRAGGQDMMVLGLHVFDLARLFGGEVEWCQARMRHQGKVPKIADARESPSTKSWAGGRRRHLRALRHGLRSERYLPQPCGLGEGRGPFGMEIIGTRGIVRLNSGFAPGISILTDPNRTPTTRTENWKDWTGGVDAVAGATFEGLTGYDASHRRVVRDWLQAIDENREPLGSGERAMKAIEMAHGVFLAGITGQRVEFPLVKRTHPLVS